MTPLPDDAALRRALADLDPAMLRAFADLVAPDARRAVLALADALDAPDPARALRDTARALGPAEVKRVLGALPDSVSGLLDRARAEVGSARADALGVASELGSLADALDVAPPASSGSPASADLTALGDALRDLASNTVGPLAQVLAHADELLDTLGRLTTEAASGQLGIETTSELQASIADLQRRAAGAADPAPVSRVLAAARAVAERTGAHEAVLELDLVARALAQAASPSSPIEAWEPLLARAEAGGWPRLARRAALVPQAARMAHGDYLGAADLAARAERVAGAAGDARTAALAAAEAGLASAIGGDVERARSSARRAANAAEQTGDAAVQARVALSEAQAIELSGDRAAASRAYHRVLALAAEVTAPDPRRAIEARAALGVGRAWSGAVDAPSRFAALEAAVRHGDATGDATVYVPAVAALARAAGEAGDLDGAIVALVRGGVRARQLAPAAAVATHFAPIEDFLRDTFGASAVDAALDAARARR